MATYIKYAYLPEYGPGDGIDFVNPQDGRAPVSLASLFNGQQFFAINSRDRAFIEALDDVWQLHRIGTADSGHDTTWNEVAVVTMDGPTEGQVLGLDEELQITNMAPTGGGSGVNYVATDADLPPSAVGHPVVLVLEDSGADGSASLRYWSGVAWTIIGLAGGGDVSSDYIVVDANLAGMSSGKTLIWIENDSNFIPGALS